MTNNYENERLHQDRFIDLHFPDASPEEREAHRADIQRFAGVMLRIASRVAQDGQATSSEKFDSIPEFEKASEA